MSAQPNTVTERNISYVLLIYSPDGADVDSTQIGRISDWIAELESSGKLIFQSPFYPAGAANYIHRDNDSAEMVKGPVSDEILVIQGAEFVKSESMKEALELAARHPVHHIPGSRVEVRKTWQVPPAKSQK